MPFTLQQNNCILLLFAKIQVLCDFLSDRHINFAVLSSDGILLYAQAFLPNLYDKEEPEERCLILKQTVPKAASILSVFWNESYINDSIFAIGGDECQLSVFRIDEQCSSLVNFYKAAKVLLFLMCRRSTMN